MVEGIIRNFCVKLFRNWASGSEFIVFCVILALMAILFSRAEPFGAILVEGIMRNICVKLFLKLVSPKILNFNKNQHNTSTS